MSHSERFGKITVGKIFNGEGDVIQRVLFVIYELTPAFMSLFSPIPTVIRYIACKLNTLTKTIRIKCLMIIA